MPPGHGFLHFVPQPCTPGILRAGQNWFFHFLSGKAQFSNSNLGGKLPINTTSLILNFSFIKKRFKRKALGASLDDSLLILSF